MRPEYYLNKWIPLKDSPDPGEISSLAERIASTFVDRYFYNDEYNSKYVDMLCDMATCFSDSMLNQISAKVLFGTIVERLCDDFEELQTESYNRLMCQVITYVRKLPQGRDIDERLNMLTIETEEQLYQRIESIRLSPDQKFPTEYKPQKAIILSRVTIGADIAITSIICQRVKQTFPDAEIVVVGNEKLKQIFCDKSKTRIAVLDYSRRGGLIERFNVWLDILDVIEQETKGLSEGEVIVLDPDSRLTQLGVLPIVDNKSYRFFNSRGKENYPLKASISELTNLWLNNVLGINEFYYPKVWPNLASMTQVSTFISKLNVSNNHNLITINLGVGGNFRKRIPGDFEIELVLALLSEPETRIILDMGFGDEERERSEKILASAAEKGFPVSNTGFQQLNTVDPTSRLIGVECGVGEIAAFITYSDEFIGYDSACQHIAAAQEVKTFTVFAGTNNVRFIRRWHACGPNLSEIIYVDTISKDKEIVNSEIITRLMDVRLQS
jgi:ADP-heptose:LPS heptosyltransferase